MRHLIVVALIQALGLTTVFEPGQQAETPTERCWLEIQLKARSVLIDPIQPTVQHEVMDPLPEPLGLLSPDGAKVAYIASDPARVKTGHDFDLFVADVDPAQPSRKNNVRRLTTDQVRPANPCWTSNNGLAFMAQRSADHTSESIWFVSLLNGSAPVRISDGSLERAWQLTVTPGGGIAYVALKQRKGKQQFCDLILRAAPAPARASQGGGEKRLLQNRHISTYVFSPDGKHVAWSEPGSLHIMNLESSAAREIPCHGIHRQLINHMAHELAWSPDGRLLAASFGFAGGVSRGVNADPNEPWPRMFAEDKVFFIPFDFAPAPDELKVGEGDEFPSPFANDEKAEISPPAGDESKPWWIRNVPDHVDGLAWVSAEDAKSRIADHPAAPEIRPEPPQRSMPPLPVNEPRP